MKIDKKVQIIISILIIRKLSCKYKIICKSGLWL